MCGLSESLGGLASVEVVDHPTQLICTSDIYLSTNTKDIAGQSATVEGDFQVCRQDVMSPLHLLPGECKL